MSKKIPVILCIDIEPDDRLVALNKCEPWAGYEAMHSLTQEMRPKLEAATGSPAHYSWFFRVDPQIAGGYGSADWALEYYREWIRIYQTAGDEIGLHPHAYRWDKKNWIADHGSQEWIEHCLDIAFEGFQRQMGFSCRSFRFGDRFMNQETMDYLQKAGVKYDLTLEPGYRAQKKMILKAKEERATGFLPDTTRMPKFPYRPKKENYLAPEAFSQGLWILPVSTGPVEMSMGRTERLLKTIFLPEQVRPHSFTLNLAFHPDNFSHVIDALLYQENIPYLNLVVRTDAAVLGKQRRHLEKNLNTLMDHSLRENFVFSTPEETIGILGYEGIHAGIKREYQFV